MKIISYNVNGIRSSMNKNLTGWLTRANPDIFCLQEIKAEPGQFDTFLFETLGYNCHWYPAQKKGYSGVAILSKTKPDNVVMGIGNPLYDDEGRVLRADFRDLTVMTLYMPSGTSGEIRQQFKMEFADYFFNYIENLLKTRPKMLICGDFNISHQPIDLHDPVRGSRITGFFPEERQWLGRFLEMGFVDSFRYLYPDAIRYTWWNQRVNARERNKGWRLDYHLVSHALRDSIADAEILDDAVHSDHCPVLLDIDA